MNAPDPNHPDTYPRRVLLAVTGLSPQVVTETLYALTRQQETPFVPTEVRLVTTAPGAEHARLNLLSADPGWFHRLRRDYGLPPIALGPEHIHVLRDAQGDPLADIRTPEENEVAADFITGLVARLTSQPQCALHVSLAGGRKTMGYYLGYALSLFGRPQDRLSHVLVSAPYESHPQFYYPTPYERVIHTLDKQQLALDCRSARVSLAHIPFVRLREGLPQRLLDGRATLTSIVDAANRAAEPPRLELFSCERRVVADGQPIELGPTEFALVLWLAGRALEDAAEVDWALDEEADAFLAVALRVLQPMSGAFATVENALAGRRGDPKLLGEYFEPHKSRINRSFETALGGAARRYAIARSGPRGRSRYALPLAPDQIEIRA